MSDHERTAIPEWARAGRELIGGRPNSVVRDRLVNSLGAEIVDDDRLRRLVTCVVCGIMGDPGDLCGRAPDGHRLTVGNGSHREETS